MILRRACRLILRASGWHVVGDIPTTGVLVGAPHTSNWDFVLMLLLMWSGGVSPVVLVKKSLFRGPLGWLLRRVGGIPVDRANPVGLVRSLVVRLRSGEHCVLVIAAEGTRKKSEYWKSGFYRIATSTRMPVVLGFVDGPSKKLGFGPTIVLSGQMSADMDQIRAFYADKRGLRPAWRTEPRLREEDATPTKGTTTKGTPARGPGKDQI